MFEYENRKRKFCKFFLFNVFDVIGILYSVDDTFHALQDKDDWAGDICRTILSLRTLMLLEVADQQYGDGSGGIVVTNWWLL